MSGKIEILNLIENEKQKIISFFQEFVQAASPNPPSHCNTDGDMMQILKSNVKDLRGFQPKPVVSLGGTDARLWRYKNIPAHV